MSVDRARYLRSEEELFAVAIALPPTERARYLARATNDDADLLARVTALLATYDDAHRLRQRES